MVFFPFKWELYLSSEDSQGLRLKQEFHFKLLTIFSKSSPSFGMLALKFTWHRFDIQLLLLT